jgi:hypothetical protein
VNLGEFLRWLLDRAYQLWPFRIVEPWEQGLRLFLGRPSSPLGRGLHMFVPLLGDIRTETTVLRALETEVQSVETEDGMALSFSLSLAYRIVDVLAYFTTLHDADASIQNLVQTWAAEEIRTSQAGNIDERLAGSIRDLCFDRLLEHGVQLDSVGFVNLVRCSTLRLIGAHSGFGEIHLPS